MRELESSAYLVQKSKMEMGMCTSGGREGGGGGDIF